MIGNTEVMMMWPWKRNKKTPDEVFEKLLNLLKLSEVEISAISGRIDNVEAKLRKIIHGKNKRQEDLEEVVTEKPIKDDGFNELRELRKSGVR